MRATPLVRGLVAVPAIALLGFASWLAFLPAPPPGRPPPPIPKPESRATLAALAPRTGARPLIAVVGRNDATETTDYLMTTAILRRADVADVVMLATDPGAVTLYPALRVLPDATIARFDAAHPEGADYVVVPAMRPTDDPRVLRWLRAQAARGAIIVAVCAGARVAADAGLLDGRRATTHWFYLRRMLDAHPAIRYVPDRRFVVDRGVATTAGISASMPAMLTLVEAIAGRTKVREVADGLGVDHWDARHTSAMFAFDRRFAATVTGNVLAFWSRDELGIALHPGMDEVALALVADAWSRTYRSRAVAYSGSTGPVSGRDGIRILPDAARKDWPAQRRIPGFDGLPAAVALDRALDGIADRYGMPTSRAVALQLEYPGPAVGGGSDGGP